MPKATGAKRKQRPGIGNSKPIAFRLPNDLTAAIDNAAARLKMTRSRVVVLVLHEYVQERGTKEIERIAKKEAENARNIDLFA